MRNKSGYNSFRSQIRASAAAPLRGESSVANNNRWPLLAMKAPVQSETHPLQTVHRRQVSNRTHSPLVCHMLHFKLVVA
ncbi:hypothetical protein CEXT_689971 [Caerostris extrusa]|uniref:Uncharacterized protein n=1 Tax=Caerostris extrusa TaxID=172846 RepID=A0AAV4SHF8_CAEEX|nr:hypothetical protein CEXT_689971 [Caerostris extrusa]